MGTQKYPSHFKYRPPRAKYQPPKPAESVSTSAKTCPNEGASFTALGGESVRVRGHVLVCVYHLMYVHTVCTCLNVVYILCGNRAIQRVSFILTGGRGSKQNTWLGRRVGGLGLLCSPHMLRNKMQTHATSIRAIPDSTYYCYQWLHLPPVAPFMM